MNPLEYSKREKVLRANGADQSMGWLTARGGHTWLRSRRRRTGHVAGSHLAFGP